MGNLLTYAVLSDNSGSALLIAYGGDMTFSPSSWGCTAFPTARRDTVWPCPKIGVFGLGGGVVLFGGNPCSRADPKGSVQG